MKDSDFAMGNKRKRTQRGVSLIEVLVVLVLLVLGILIIVRLYPSGFFSITSVGNAALADSLGQAAVQAQAQDVSGLPESILPVNNSAINNPTNDLTPALAADASYDPDYNPNVEPDYSKTLDKARVITNEIITVPASSGTARQSVYVVNYGPIVLGTAAAPLNPAGDPTQFPKYLTVNSQPWTAVLGDAPAAVLADPVLPQTGIFPRQERFLVDLNNRMIAVPYAPYTPTGAKTAVGTDAAASYAQKMVVMILASDGNTYTQYLNVPAGTPKDDTNPYAPFGSDNQHYLPDTTTNYHGGWFDPTMQYPDTSNSVAQTPVPVKDAKGNPITWQRVMLYRPYQALAIGSAFSNDPYEFMLAAGNFGSPTPAANAAPKSNANPGALSFNPKAAGGSGSSALMARISYVTYSWKTLHEDRDIPALPQGNTASIRLTLKNLKRAGDANADNTIYTGLAGSGDSMEILDLDSGRMIAPIFINQDPTNPSLNDEDLNGTINDTINYAVINVSYATGRLTFPSNTFGDNPPPGNTPHAHRIRIFYAGDADWTVAVQKASSYYTLNPITTAGGTDPMLLPGQYAVDQTANQAANGAGTQNLYFPRSDAGKSVEIDGTYLYVDKAGDAPQFKTFAGTIAIPPTVVPIGASSYVSVNLTDPTLTSGLPAVVPPATVSQVTVTAVRGLSVRSVVAWKERDRWKVHSVDTVLNRAQ